MIEAFSNRKRRQITWDNLHYAVEVLANANALSQSWLDTMFRSHIGHTEPTKERIDWLYHQLQNDPTVKPQQLQEQYCQFSKKARHQSVLITLFLRLFPQPTAQELKNIETFCEAIPDQCDAGKHACLTVQSLLRQGFLDKEYCHILFQLPQKALINLLCDDFICENLWFLEKRPNIANALTKPIFQQFLKNPFPGPRMAAFCRVASWELSEECQTISQVLPA